jgi:hypothetical protein
MHDNPTFPLTIYEAKRRGDCAVIFYINLVALERLYPVQVDAVVYPSVAPPSEPCNRVPSYKGWVKPESFSRCPNIGEAE